MSTDRPLLSFPCEYTMKIMGKHTEEFEHTVLMILRKHIPDLGEGAVQRRDSANQNYLSLSVQFVARHRDQLDALYRDISQCPLVLMAL